MSPRIRSLICLTRSGRARRDGAIPSKCDRAHERDDPVGGHALLVDREVAAEPDDHQRVVPSGKTPSSDGRTAPVGVVDQEVHECRVVERVGPDVGESGRVFVGALAERRGQLVARGRGRWLAFVAPQRPDGRAWRDDQLVGREAERGERTEHRVVRAVRSRRRWSARARFRLRPARSRRVAGEHDHHRVAAELVLVADIVGVDRRARRDHGVLARLELESPEPAREHERQRQARRRGSRRGRARRVPPTTGSHAPPPDLRERQRPN